MESLSGIDRLSVEHSNSEPLRFLDLPSRPMIQILRYLNEKMTYRMQMVNRQMYKFINANRNQMVMRRMNELVIRGSVKVVASKRFTSLEENNDITIEIRQGGQLRSITLADSRHYKRNMMDIAQLSPLSLLADVLKNCHFERIELLQVTFSPDEVRFLEEQLGQNTHCRAVLLEKCIQNEENSLNVVSFLELISASEVTLLDSNIANFRFFINERIGNWIGSLNIFWCRQVRSAIAQLRRWPSVPVPQMIPTFHQFPPRYETATVCETHIDSLRRALQEWNQGQRRIRRWHIFMNDDYKDQEVITNELRALGIAIQPQRERLSMRATNLNGEQMFVRRFGGSEYGQIWTFSTFP